MKGKYKALDIANMFVEFVNAIPDDSIDNMKVNKLCYYSQAWCLTRLGYPLFSDDVEAWKYGPLIPSVYNAFKCCGKNPIIEPTYHFDEDKLTSEELSLLVDVYMTYGKYTSIALSDKTHQPGTPWKTVFEEGKNNTIPNDLMVKWFSESNELEVFKPNLSEENVVKYD